MDNVAFPTLRIFILQAAFVPVNRAQRFEFPRNKLNWVLDERNVIIFQK